MRINPHRNEAHCKVVYCGPARAGKSDSLAAISRRGLKPSKVVSVNSEVDRTLFFDYLQLDLGKIDGLRIRIHLYVLPARARAKARQALMRDADAVVFVADTRPGAIEADINALATLEDDLEALSTEPVVVFQWTRTSLDDGLPADDLNALLNPTGLPAFEASTATGEGVIGALNTATKLALQTSPLMAARRPNPPPLPRRRARRHSSARLRSLASEEQRQHPRRAP